MDNIKDYYSQIRENPEFKNKYNLFLRSLGRVASKFDWSNSEDADGVPILARHNVTNADPNIKIAYDNFSSIQNEKASYMASKIKRVYSDKIEDKVKTKYQDFDRLNSFNTKLQDMMVSCVGWGNTYSLCYLDENKKIRFKEINAWNAKVFYDENGEPKEAVICYQHEDSSYLYFYDKLNVTVYKSIDSKVDYVNTKTYITVENETTLHGFKEIPVIEWINNKQKRGNAQKATSLIDAYDRLISDGVTEWATLRNAYLFLKDMGFIDEEAKASMQKTGLIIGNSDSSEIRFVTKDVNPEFTELLADKVWSGIWVVACSVDPIALSTLANVTAFQIAQMYRCMEQDSQNTESRWQRSLEHLDRVLKSYWTKLDESPVSDYDTYNVNYEFVRNLPRDILSELEALRRAGGELPQSEIFIKYGYDEDKAKKLAKEHLDSGSIGSDNQQLMLK